MSRVLLVTNDYPPDRGGIQTYVRELVTRTGHEVRVVAPAHPDAASHPGVVRHPTWRFMLPTPRVRRWVLDEVSAWNPDVVLFGAPHPPALLGPSIAKRSGVPYVVLAHGAETTVAAAIPGVRQALRRSLRRAAVRLAVSDFTADRVQRLTGKPCQRLGVGVTVPAVESEASPRGDILCVSRLVPRKGQHRLIDAVARLEGWAGTLVLVGSGRRGTALRRRATRRGVRIRIEDGLTDAEVSSRMRQAAVFAMPCRSRWFGLEVEGLGIVFLEAAAHGLPVVAGRSGGAPETIIPGVSGFLAETPKELASALSLLLTDPDSLRVMGEAGRRFVDETFSWAKVMERFDAAVQSVVSAGAGGEES